MTNKTPTLSLCPFCGGIPSFAGDAAEWKDDARYVEMSIECYTCDTSMTKSIGWMRARDMSTEELRAVLMTKLATAWNRREGYRQDSEDIVADTAPNAETSTGQDVEPEKKPENKPDADGWYNWGGGECPVPKGTLVRVQLRRGAIYTGYALETYVVAGNMWHIGIPGINSSPHASDIVRYQIIKKVDTVGTGGLV